jgi:O-antigen/teichoic acid export membrane protein
MSEARPPGETPSVFSAAGLLIGGRTIAFLATLFTAPLLVRLFSTGEFGTYKQLFLVFATLYPIAQIGMAESLFFFLPGAGRSAGRYVANSVVLLGAAGLISVAAMIAARDGIARWLGNPALTAYLPLIGVFAVLMLTAAGLEIMMTAGGRYRLAATTYGVSDIVRAVCLVVPAVMFRSLNALLVGAVVFACLRLVTTGVYFRWVFKSGFQLDTALLGQQLAYSIPFGLSAVFEVAQANYHQYAVAHYFDAAAFAVYAVGCLQIPLVDFVATSTSSVMMVQFAQARQDRRDDRPLEIWLDATRKLALVFFPLAAVLFVAAHGLIVTMFTERYAASVSVFHVSLATIALSAFATDAVLRAYAQTRFLMAMSALKLMLVAILIGPCLRAFGLPGAILATVITLAIAKALALVRIRRLLGAAPARMLPWRDLGAIARASIAAAVAGTVATWTLHDAPFAALAASAFVTAGVAGALLLFGGVVSAHERNALAGRLRRVVGLAPEPAI